MLRGFAKDETIKNMRSVIHDMVDDIPRKHIKTVISKFIGEYSQWTDEYPNMETNIGSVLAPFFVKHKDLFNSLEFVNINDSDWQNDTYDQDMSFELLIELIKGIKHFNITKSYAL